MGIGALRRHYERIHDAEAEMGSVEGVFSHPNEDPNEVANKVAALELEKAEKLEEDKKDEDEF